MRWTPERCQSVDPSLRALTPRSKRSRARARRARPLRRLAGIAAGPSGSAPRRPLRRWRGKPALGDPTLSAGRQVKPSSRTGGARCCTWKRRKPPIPPMALPDGPDDNVAIVNPDRRVSPAAGAGPEARSIMPERALHVNCDARRLLRVSPAALPISHAAAVTRSSRCQRAHAAAAWCSRRR
jgi:hypothetical protein